MSLKLALHGDNFAVCGPNGTGKSGVVDAIEFGLTGSVSRLSGKGTAGISVEDHGPHVDHRNRPDMAHVAIKVHIASLGQDVTIERSVKNANAPTITPSSPQILQVLDSVASHPEFVLSRRELIQYVLATPGDRSKEIQSLLRLERVEVLRGTLQKIANASQRAVEPLKRERDVARDALLTALDVPRLSEDEVLAAANAQRKFLELPPLSALTATTSLRDGLEAVGKEKGVQAVPKAQALADLARLRELLQRSTGPEERKRRADIIEELDALRQDPAVESSVARERFLQIALDQVESELCPVCDMPWDIGKLRELIGKKLQHLEGVAKKRESVQRNVAPVLDLIVQLKAAADSCERHGSLGKPPIDMKALTAFATHLDGSRHKLEQFLPLATSIAAVEASATVPADVLAALGAFEAMVAGIPDPTQ